MAYTPYPPTAPPVSGGGGGPGGGVTSVNGDVGPAVSLNAADVGAPTTGAMIAAINQAVADLIDGAPGTIDTLNELAAALGDDPNFAASMTTALAGKQPVDATLTAFAAAATAANKLAYFNGTDSVALTDLSAFARTILDDADGAAVRTTIGAQAVDATLTALAGMTTSANALPYFTGTDVVTTTTLSSFARTILDDTTAAAVLTTLGIGTGATFAAKSDRSIQFQPTSPQGLVSAIPTPTLAQDYLVPAALNGMTIKGVMAGLTTTGTTATTVQIIRVRGGVSVNVLSPATTIDANESDSTTGTAGTVTGANATLATGDLLQLSVTALGTNAAGLKVDVLVGP